MTRLLADERPVARKGHGCNACGGRIAKGDQYRRQRLVDGGDHYVFKCHALCDAAYWLAYRDAGLMDDEGPDWDEVREHVLRFFSALVWGSARVADRDTT